MIHQLNHISLSASLTPFQQTANLIVIPRATSIIINRVMFSKIVERGYHFSAIHDPRITPSYHAILSLRYAYYEGISTSNNIQNWEANRYVGDNILIRSGPCTLQVPLPVKTRSVISFACNLQDLPRGSQTIIFVAQNLPEKLRPGNKRHEYSSNKLRSALENGTSKEKTVEKKWVLMYTRYNAATNIEFSKILQYNHNMQPYIESSLSQWI